MRTVLLLTAIAATALATAPAMGRTASAPSTTSVITVGGGFARSCFLSAEARDADAGTIAECDRALAEEALNPHDQVATYVNRGILHQLRKHSAAARADYEAALALNPNEAEAWLNLGLLLYNQGDSAGALDRFERAIRLKTRAPELAYLGRGLAHEERGEVKAAYADLRRAQSLKPGWALPVQELARYRVRRR